MPSDCVSMHVASATPQEKLRAEELALAHEIPAGLAERVGARFHVRLRLVNVMHAHLLRIAVLHREHTASRKVRGKQRAANSGLLAGVPPKPSSDSGLGRALLAKRTSPPDRKSIRLFRALPKCFAWAKADALVSMAT
jgi:hypothetical protein